jgi:hypothetical protein
MNTDSPNSAPEEAVASASVPTENKLAAFLFSEENPVFAEASSASSAPDQAVAAEQNQLDTLAKQAAAAQAEVEPATVVKESQIPDVVSAVQSAPIIDTVQPAVVPFVPPVVQQQAAPVQQQQQAPLDQAAIRQQLNIYEVTEADYDAIFSTDDKQESMKAMSDMLQKAVRQSVTMSSVLVQEAIAQVQQQVQPYMQFADEQQHSALESGFYAKHPDLKSAQPVVEAVLKQFRASGAKFATPQQLFDAAAQNTKAYLLQMQQLGQTVAPAAQGLQQTQQVKPAMAALPSGGRGGAGNGGGNSGKVNTAQRLFG